MLHPRFGRCAQSSARIEEEESGERERYKMSPLLLLFPQLPSSKRQREFIAFDRRISVAHAS
jgi:hypothetical protein